MSKEKIVPIALWDWFFVVLWFVVTGTIFWAVQAKNDLLLGLILPVVLIGVTLYLLIRYLLEQGAMLKAIKEMHEQK